MKAKQETLKAARERLCHTGCKYWTTYREQYVFETYETDTGEETVMRRNEWEVPEASCRYDLKPLTSTGEDCPYFAKA